jgi:hypothetical protein
MRGSALVLCLYYRSWSNAVANPYELAFTFSFAFTDTYVDANAGTRRGTGTR